MVKIDPETGEISVFREYEVVAGNGEVTDPELQKTVAEANEIEEGPGRQPGPHRGGRHPATARPIAAQTAGQVYRQRLREAERDVVYHQYVSREGEILTGVVTRTTESAVVLDMSRGVEAVLSVSEQLPGEHYRIGQHLKVFVLGPSHDAGPGPGREPHTPRIPQAPDGDGDSRDLQRLGRDPRHCPRGRQPLEGGGREPPAVDAKGGKVQRGTRIQAIVAELNGEKVDVVLWNEDAAQFVAEALSPAEVIEVRIDEEHRIANVIVPERQLSLAIGREGRTRGWRPSSPAGDIRSDAGVAAAGWGSAYRSNGRGGRRQCRNAGLIISHSARVRSAARCERSGRCSSVVRLADGDDDGRQRPDARPGHVCLRRSRLPGEPQPREGYCPRAGDRGRVPPRRYTQNRRGHGRQSDANRAARRPRRPPHPVQRRRSRSGQASSSRIWQPRWGSAPRRSSAS